jgi:CCR4-NOT transcription complex subunit 9
MESRSAPEMGRHNKQTGRELSDACEAVLVDPLSTESLRRLHQLLEKAPGSSYSVWSYDSMPVILLQNIIQPFRVLNSEELSEEKSMQVCVALNVLQILVTDRAVKKVFVDARFPYYIYKFFMMSSSSQHYESLRISALGVMQALLQSGDAYVHNQIKTTEIVPLLLKIIDIGSEVSKLLAVRVFSLTIGTDDGLSYACQTFDRFSAINLMFNSLGSQAVSLRSVELVKAVLRVYIRLCDKSHIRASLASRKPDALFTSEAQALISSEQECKVLFDSFGRMIGQR